MNYIETEIKGVFVIEPRVFPDQRGYFFEAWKKEEFEQHVGHVDFIQDNESKSSRGVLRGLHYQKGDASQAKLVRVVKGAVLDVAVDLRRDSATFGTGVSATYRATDHYNARFFVDYNLLPSHSRGSREWMSTLAAGLSFAVAI